MKWLIWPETGEIITEKEYKRRLKELWAAQNKRVEALKVMNQAARVVSLPVDRRAAARRRWRQRLWIAAPTLIFAVVVIVLMILFYSGPAPCEPYSNC